MSLIVKTFLIDIESVTTNTTLTIEHSDTDQDADFNAIKKDDVQEYDQGIYYVPDIPTTVSDQRAQWGYIGKKRYVRLVVTGENTLGAMHVLGHPERVPCVGPRSETQFPV